ncbi:MAG TPA: NAD-dependent deacylase [Gaiellaceae bacterium]|nr:NAD-dependent deacylase [Gaiellaceae bacterium]
MTTERLAGLIRTHQPCVVLTGAGVSTESGIPDFRSAGGIWAEFDPLEVASIDGFRRDPTRVWEFYRLRLSLLADAQPNDGHRALARLEQLGLVRAVVTQNVDGLHQAAGSADVVEVHGSIRGAVCIRCGSRYAADEVGARLPVPHCDCGEVLKPGVVMFGELLPVAALERASELARAARLLLVVGSTLEVHPVGSLPFETLRRGGSLAIVNRGPTALDEEADLRLDGSAGAILQETLALLE